MFVTPVLRGGVTRFVISTAFGALLASRVAKAATFEVVNVNPDGAGSLAQAVIDANAAAGVDVITFASGVTGTITPSATLAITDSVEIQGPGTAALAVSGGNARRVFELGKDDTSLAVTIRGLTVTQGFSEDDGGGLASRGTALMLEDVVFSDNRAHSGGAIYATGRTPESLVIRRARLSGNRAESMGGAAYFESTGGAILVDASIIADNVGRAGGGVAALDFGRVFEVRDSVVTGNVVRDGGGGLYAGYVNGVREFRVVRSEISHNVAGRGGGIGALLEGFVVDRSTIHGNTAGEGGGVWLSGARASVRSSTITNNRGIESGAAVLLESCIGVALEHTTIADNLGPAADGFAGVVVTGNPESIATAASSVLAGTTPDTADVLPPVKKYLNARFTFLGASDAKYWNDEGGNVIGTDPKLRALGDYGGPTPTRPPESGSPLIDAGDPTFADAAAVDQRGEARVANGRIDIGAVELRDCDRNDACEGDGPADPGPTGEGGGKKDGGGCAAATPASAGWMVVLAALTRWWRRR